ncbi:PhoU domain-containing protein [Bacteriovorax sp. Seq25_V]|uniref:PhoU domain-containing protein n=1 Tax=Bacteriovorax sp. Seq25_V TaxID=1201288 RepID=UPI000389F726|nr:PhoU domain-containing protein [Bacteriovorax sp. Seq25_V]EQC46277.1 Na+/Pi-cotransporter [Bacteriovorax sp. Seq25_V]
METLQQFLYFISGLAIFYFGQRTLSQGLQTIGASSVKHIVHNEGVRNPLVNFWHGARLSLLSFSSTMSSLVITGLVNANLLKNRRVLPMMMGTALGASTILFILSFSGHNRGLNLIATGLLFGLIFRSFKYRSIGKFLLGLGLLFLGLAVMEESVKLLATHSEIVGYLDFINQMPFVVSLFLSTFIGLSLAVSLTSSTMVLAIVSVSARLQVFSVAFSFGLCVGAIISSYFMTFVTAKKSARAFAVRKAFAPLFIFSLATLVSFIMMVLLDDYFIFPFSTLDAVVYGSLCLSVVAFFYSFALKPMVINLALKLYPDDEVKEQSKLQFLGEGRFLSSTMAYVLVEMEVSKLMDIVDRMFEKCHEYLGSQQKGARALAKIKDYERIIDNIQREIDIFIQKVISNGAGDDDSEMSLAYLKLSSSLEQVADHLDKMATTLTKFYEFWQLDDDENQTLIKYFEEVREMFNHSQDIFNEVIDLKSIGASEHKERLSRALEMKKEILNAREEYANRHHQEDVRKALYFSDMLISIAKLRGSVRDIYQTLLK